MLLDQWSDDGPSQCSCSCFLVGFPLCIYKFNHESACFYQDMTKARGSTNHVRTSHLVGVVRGSMLIPSLHVSFLGFASQHSSMTIGFDRWSKVGVPSKSTSPKCFCSIFWALSIKIKSLAFDKPHCGSLSRRLIYYLLIAGGNKDGWL